MDKVLSVDQKARRLRVQAGMTIKQLLEAATKHGMGVPLGSVPAFADLTLGGVLLTGAHGSNFKGRHSLVRGGSDCLKGEVGAGNDEQNASSHAYARHRQYNTVNANRATSSSTRRGSTPAAPSTRRRAAAPRRARCPAASGCSASSPSSRCSSTRRPLRASTRCGSGPTRGSPRSCSRWRARRRACSSCGGRVRQRGADRKGQTAAG